MLVGNLIKFERLKRGMTQKDLCSGICAISYLSLIENGKIVPNEEIVSLLLERLDINIKIFLKMDNSIIKEKFNEWYNFIRNRDINNSTDLKNKIQNLYPKGFHDPTLQCYYYLLLLRHKILTSDYIEINNILTRIKQFKDYLQDSSLIFYFHTLGYYEYELGKPITSLNYLKKAKSLADMLNVKESDLYYHMALTFLKLQDSSNALVNANLALSEYQTEVNLLRITDCNILIGIANIKIKNFDEARYIFESLLSQTLTNEQKGKVLHNLSLLYYKLGLYDNAINTLNQAIKVKRDTSTDTSTKSISYYLLSKIYYETKNIKEAEKALITGLKFLNIRRETTLRIKYKILQFQISQTELDSKFMNYLIKEAIPFFEEHDIDYAIEYLTKIANYFESKRCYKQANYFLKRALKLK